MSKQTKQLIILLSLINIAFFQQLTLPSIKGFIKDSNPAKKISYQKHNNQKQQNIAKPETLSQIDQILQSYQYLKIQSFTVNQISNTQQKITIKFQARIKTSNNILKELSQSKNNIDITSIMLSGKNLANKTLSVTITAALY
jgi:hypothetical protein